MEQALQDRIVDILRAYGETGVSVHEIRFALGEDAPSRKVLRKTMRTLARQGLATQIDSDFFALGNALVPVAGVLRLIQGQFWVVPDDDDEQPLAIAPSAVGDAVAGDRVVAEVNFDNGRGRRGGTIREVPDAKRVRSGRVRRVRHGWAVDIEGAGEPVFVERRSAPAATDPGTTVTVHITGRAWGPRRGPKFPQRALVGVIDAGHGQRTADRRVAFDKVDPRERDADVLLNQLAAGMGIDIAFSDEALVEANAAVEDTEVGYGEDLTGLPFVTVDPDDAKDFDDAVYAEAIENNGVRLWVAIADVSSYVKCGGALDREALARSFSVYLPGRVYPMLPPALSENVCSLREGVLRRVMWVSVDFGPRGALRKQDAGYGVIRSRRRLTYGEAQAHHTGAVPLAGEVGDSLDRLFVLAKVLRRRRVRRGMIDLELPEPKIGLSADEREVTFVTPAPRLDAHRMIEECMLAANEAIASLLARKKVPALYRIHEEPSEDRLAGLHRVMALLEINVSLSDVPTTQELNQVLGIVKGEPRARVLSSLVLRALPRAKYSPDPLPHFGIGAPRYLHFTSPIRRYPDLLVHRALRAWLDHDETPEADLRQVATVVNAGEQIADRAERFAGRLLGARLMLDRVGDRFHGSVTGVSSFGVFVSLDDPYVEALIQIRDLGDEYYVFDEDAQSLTGRDTGTRYALGDEVDVTCVSVDLAEARIRVVPAVADERPRRGKMGGSRRRSRRHR